MPITPAERRFLRSWEEQRQGGKKKYIALYSFAMAFSIFMGCVALGLITSLPFIKEIWLEILGIVSVIGGFFLSVVMWNRQEKKFKRIIQREIAESN